MDRHRQTPWHARKLTEVYETLHTSEEGLGDAEAAERLKKHGRNELRSKPPKTILQMLKAQIVDPMVLILIGAAAFSAILQEWTEAAVIFCYCNRQRCHWYCAGKESAILSGGSPQHERPNG